MRFNGLEELDSEFMPGSGLIVLLSVFLLLLMFVLHSLYFIIPSGLGISMPDHFTSSPANWEKIVITVNNDNCYVIDNNCMQLQEIRAYLKASVRKNQRILIRSNKKAEFDRVALLWDSARVLGFKQIEIAAEE